MFVIDRRKAILSLHSHSGAFQAKEVSERLAATFVTGMLAHAGIYDVSHLRSGCSRRSRLTCPKLGHSDQHNPSVCKAESSP